MTEIVKENPLYKRKEIIFEVKSEITPSKPDAEKIITEKFSTKKENIKIKRITGKFGEKTFIITANIYDSEKDKNEIEQKPKKPKEKKPENKTEVKKE